jgi:ligand-binding sensor domain-containing protein
MALFFYSLLIISSEVAAAPFRDMAIDAKGLVYAATWDGITIYDQGGNILFRYTKADGLPTDILTSVCLAPDGAAWFGSTHGVIRLWQGKMSTFTIRNGLNDNVVYCVAYSPTLGLLAGTERGVCRLVGDRFEPLDDEHGFARRRVYDIHVDQKGTAWFAKEAGLSRYANEQDRTVFRRDMLQFPVDTAPIRNEIFCVTTDSQNRPWVGTRTGISYFDGEKWHAYVESPQDHNGFPKLLNPYVTSLSFSADGQLWIGHGNAEKNSITVMKKGSWRHVPIGGELEAGSVYKIHSYDDRIWLATENGIYWIEDFSNRPIGNKFASNSESESGP